MKLVNHAKNVNRTQECWESDEATVDTNSRMPQKRCDINGGDGG